MWNFLFRNKATEWNKQYREGRWEILRSSLEEPRFDALIALTKEYIISKKILEIGCGEGLLLRKLPFGYTKFLGIDISDVAITRAGILQNERTSFAVADMDWFLPRERFDLIIFNESLYYSKDPLGLLNKYSAFLNEQGVIATSIYANSMGMNLVNAIETHFQYLHRQVTTNARGTWYCHVLQGRSIEHR